MAGRAVVGMAAEGKAVVGEAEVQVGALQELLDNEQSKDSSDSSHWNTINQ